MFEQLAHQLIKYRLSIIVNLFLFLFYFSISSLTPYAADDYTYKINPLSNEFNLTVLENVYQFQIQHYLNWSGRAIAHLLLQLFLIPEKLYFNFVNSIFQVLLINIIFFYSYNRIASHRKDASILLFINILLFSGFYKYSGMSIYLATSVHYTWMHLIVLIYYLLFWRFYIGGKDQSNKLIVFLFGLIVGCTNEHVFAAQLSFFFVLFFYSRINRSIKLPTFFFQSFFGVAIGGAILVFAPGNSIRAQTLNNPISFNRVIDYIGYDIVWLVDYIKPFWLIMIPLTLYYCYYYKQKIEISYQSLIILMIGIVSSIAMVVSPSYHSGTNLFFYICLLIFTFSNIDFSLFSKKLIYINIFFSIVLQLYMCSNHFSIKQYDENLEKVILSERMNGKKDIVVHSIQLKTNRFIHYYGIEKDPHRPRNLHIANYYGINSIRSIDRNSIE